MNFKVVVIAFAVFGLGLFGIDKLADATLTTHVEQDPASRMAFVVHGSINDEAEHSLHTGIDSLVRNCQLEVGRDIGAQRIEAIGGDRFRFVFQPALDEADQRQFKGCVGDIVIDHLQASVESIHFIAPEEVNENR